MRTDREYILTHSGEVASPMSFAGAGFTLYELTPVWLEWMERTKAEKPNLYDAITEILLHQRPIDLVASERHFSITRLIDEVNDSLEIFDEIREKLLGR